MSLKSFPLLAAFLASAVADYSASGARFPQAVPGFAASTPFANRTVALDIVDSNYLSLEEMLFHREIAREVDDTLQEDDFLNFMELTERTAPSTQSKFYHYEQGSLYRAVQVGTIVGTATAASTTITLNAASYTNVGSNRGMINRSPLKVTDEVMLPGRIWGYCIAKTGSGLTTQYTIIRRNGSSEDIGAALTALQASGGSFAIPSNAHAPGSGQPDEFLDSLATRFEGQMQTFKGIARIDGDADAARLEVEVRGQTFYYNKLAIEAAKKAKMDKAFALMFSPGGSFTNSSGIIVDLTTGLEGFILNLGQNYYYQRSVGFTEIDMAAICARIKALSGCKEYIWELGPSLKADIEAFLSTRTANGGLSYNTFGIGSDSARAVDLGFDTFKIHDIVFHLHETRAFQHPEVTGLAGMNYDACGFLIPGDKVRMNRMVNGEMKNGPIQSLTLRYKVSSKGQSRRWIEWETDRRTNGNFDQFQWNVQCQEGFQMAGARRFIRVQGY